MPSARRGDLGSLYVTCCKRTWELPGVPASVWIASALSEDMSGVFPGMVTGADAERMLDLWHEVPDMRRRCVNVARVALSRASGREWYWAYNLIKEAMDSWPYLNGMLVRQGVRADQMPLADWMDAAYTLLRELLEKKDRTALESRLQRIPKGAADVVKPRMSSVEDLMAFARD